MSAWEAATNTYSKAGVMVRAEGSAANAPFYDVVACPNGIVYVQYRDSAGASGGQPQTNQRLAVPVWLKIGRVGTTYTAYTSPDGVTWTAVTGSARTMSNLSGSVQIGLAVDIVTRRGHALTRRLRRDQRHHRAAGFRHHHAAGRADGGQQLPHRRPPTTTPASRPA